MTGEEVREGQRKVGPLLGDPANGGLWETVLLGREE